MSFPTLHTPKDRWGRPYTDTHDWNITNVRLGAASSLSFEFIPVLEMNSLP
jgi:hypothetical protein